MLPKISLAEAFASFSEPWNPRIAGEINDSYVKLVKLSGAFDWHHHETEDELFLVVSGRMLMGLRDEDVEVGPGEFIIIPRGVEHRPEAIGGECHVLLLEPKSTLNTGTEMTERTVNELEWIPQLRS